MYRNTTRKLIGLPVILLVMIAITVPDKSGNEGD